MAQKKQMSEISTEELARMLVMRKFLRGYFQSGKNPEFWGKAVLEVEQELRKRGALS